MSDGKRLILENKKIRAYIQIEGTSVKESYYGINNGREELVTETTDNSSFAACRVNVEPYDGTDIEYNYPDQPVVLHNDGPDEYTDEQILVVDEKAPKLPFEFKDYKLSREDNRQVLVLNAESAEGDRIERTIALDSESDFFEITNKVYFNRNVNLEYCSDFYNFSPGPDPDFTWTPQIKLDPSCISCDWTFKSPSVMIQKDKSAMVLVPDVDFLYEDKSIMYSTTSVDLDITTEPAPEVSYGFVPSIPHYHSLFIHPDGYKRPVPEGYMTYKYFLFAGSDVPEKQVYRRITGFLWDRFGRKNFLEGHDAQLKSFNLMEKEAWHWMARKFWIEFDYKGQRCGGFRDYHRGLTDDIWFHGWWNNLRTAYGMEVYARRREHRQTSEKAHAILNLILNAPKKDGAIPAVYIMENGERIWTAGSSSNFGGPRDCYHTISMTWTAYWLLKWKKDLEPDNERIMPICLDYAEFLLRNQQENGFIPSYFREEDLSVEPTLGLNKEGAEPAVSALYLAELYLYTDDSRYLEAAEKAVKYIEEVIVPENKWYDFETFYSCSPKDYGFYDEITGQYPQCNIAMLHTARTSLMLSQITGKKDYYEFGTKVLDYLSLFQQVWSHPRMEINLVGGFTTQNTDAEWSDSRQSYCAIIYLEYFEETGELVYLERAIAALRATLAISPYENWSHRGYNNEPGYFSSFHWGIGTGMTTVEILYDKYGDIFVNLDKAWAYGVDGCTVRNMEVEKDTVDLTVESNIHFVAPLKIVFRVSGGSEYTVKVNGQSLGKYSADELREGIEWYFSKERV